MVSPAVSDHSVAFCEWLDLLPPGAQIGRAASVQKDDRFASALLNVGQAQIANMNLLELLLHRDFFRTSIISGPTAVAKGWTRPQNGKRSKQRKTAAYLPFAVLGGSIWTHMLSAEKISPQPNGPDGIQDVSSQPSEKRNVEIPRHECHAINACQYSWNPDQSKCHTCAHDKSK